jgi:hypothetical protein
MNNQQHQTDPGAILPLSYYQKNTLGVPIATARGGSRMRVLNTGSTKMER